MTQKEFELKPSYNSVKTELDLISRQALKDLGAECIAKRDENGNLIPLGSIDSLPSVSTETDHCNDEELDFVQPHKKIEVNLVKFDTPYTDTISRQAAIDAMREETCMSCWDAKYILKHLPSVSTEKTGRCKDCKYFEYDSVAKVDGIPLIVAHEICTKWGDGCKTREDGFCYLAEKREL